MSLIFASKVGINYAFFRFGPARVQMFLGAKKLSDKHVAHIDVTVHILNLQISSESEKMIHKSLKKIVLSQASVGDGTELSSACLDAVSYLGPNKNAGNQEEYRKREEIIGYVYSLF